MNKEMALLDGVKHGLEKKFGKDNIDVETKRKVLISRKGSPAQEFDMRIKLKDRPVIFIEIENAQADFSENVAKYWKWLENFSGAPNKIALIQLFGPRKTNMDYLSHKETAQFVADKAKNRIKYRQIELKNMQPEAIAKIIYREMNKFT